MCHRIIKTVAPLRVCDNGGWTDTWFAGHGSVFNLAVYPYAEVQVRVLPRARAGGRFAIHAENYGERYVIDKPDGRYGKHPLLEAAFDLLRLPDDLSLEVSIFCEAPAGCSMGTSAAVSVALVGALDCVTPGRLSPYEVAMSAHRIETELLGHECGIQDQLAAAFGGINLIEMNRFPHAAVSPLHVPNDVWWELESRLAVVFVGRPHCSSMVHRLVIADLEGAGPDSPKLRALRATAPKSRDALYAGDFAALGRAMVENTDAQAALHPALVGAGHLRVIDVARRHGAVGWKVNGAGGDGGSVTILTAGDAAEKRAMIRAMRELDPPARDIPVLLSRYGLRRWELATDAQGRSGVPGKAVWGG